MGEGMLDESAVMSRRLADTLGLTRSGEDWRDGCEVARMGNRVS